jgi:RNA recognition motif-containing protein
LIYYFDLASIAALPVYPDRSPNGDRRVPVESVYASNVSQFLYPAPLPFMLMRVPQALAPHSAFLNAKENISFMNIYVGNLSYSMTEDELRALFTEFGSVDSAKLIMDRDSGQSKGFGFVEMSDNSGGQQAIEGLNGRDINGRALTVNKAKPREERPRGGRGGYGRGNRY